jgi:hypothetical protein
MGSISSSSSTSADRSAMSALAAPPRPLAMASRASRRGLLKTEPSPGRSETRVRSFTGSVLTEASGLLASAPHSTRKENLDTTLYETLPQTNVAGTLALIRAPSHKSA